MSNQQNPSFGLLPALKHLGELADVRPTIIVDTREQTPLPFSRLKTQAGTLVTGDYSIAGLESLFSIERKSIADLTACCIGENRSRFEKELLRLKAYRFKRLLIVGSELDIQNCRYHSSIAPKSVFGSLAAWEMRFDLPAIFKPNPEAAARQVESWAYYFARESVCVVNDLWRSSSSIEKEAAPADGS
jgi:DNA excision repair protein ERCC-4